MSPELIAILGVGVALAGILIAGQRAARADTKDLRKEIAGVRTDTDKGLASLRTDMDKGLASLRDEVGSLRERMARLEGLLEGLREAISGRRDAT